MKSLLHARVITVWSLTHRVKFKTSCILSFTASYLQGSLQETLSKSGKSLGPWRDPQVHGSLWFMSWSPPDPPHLTESESESSWD
jgi:hypothetical protein